ncbi:MAG: hypothetical protein J0L82_19295 [Deltaproteobacteria bacterium]|jgi:hypothetical protein|nr:hypothetical protein [Deltaproteobacteria bacterium]
MGAKKKKIDEMNSDELLNEFDRSVNSSLRPADWSRGRLDADEKVSQDFVDNALDSVAQGKPIKTGAQKSRSKPKLNVSVLPQSVVDELLKEKKK